jgi:hypothetical protein
MGEEYWYPANLKQKRAAMIISQEEWYKKQKIYRTCQLTMIALLPRIKICMHSSQYPRSKYHGMRN